MDEDQRRSPKKGVDYYVIPPPSDSLRLWAMTITGIFLLMTSFAVLLDATFDVFPSKDERPFEEVGFLFATGLAFMWFGSKSGYDPSETDLVERRLKRRR